MEELKNYGIDEVTISPELTKEQINELKINIPCEIKAYGRQQVMISEYCPVGSIVGGFSNCKKCSMPCINGKKYTLKDRVDAEFLIVPDNVDCQSTIYNSKITSIVTKNLNVDNVRIDIRDESVNEINNIIAITKMGEKLTGNQYTNGHIARPV